MKNQGSLVVFVTILLVSLVATLYMIAPYLMAIFMGVVLMLMIKPFHEQLLQRRFSPQNAAVLATLGTLIVIVGPVLTFSILAGKEGINFARWLMTLEHGSFQDYLDYLSKWGPLSYLALDPGEINNYLGEIIQSAGKLGTQILVNLASSVPQTILQLLLACLTCFCLLMDGDRLFKWIFSKIPISSEIRDSLTTSFKDMAVSVVIANLAAAVSQALVMCLAYLILNVPSAFLAGGLTFILAWIPVFGATPVWIIGAGYLYLQGSAAKAGAMVLFGLIIGMIDNFVRPWVLKGRGEMHPLVSLVAIFGGLQMFGLFGVLIGPILVAVLISLLQVWPSVAKPYGLGFSEK